MKKPIAGMDFVQGEMILADKPYGWTSFAVVSQWKKWTKAKTGHAGTLDPLASGLMILCTGSWTKKLGTLLGLPKEYTGIIRLGAVTPTYDLESVPEPGGPWQQLTHANIEQAVQTLRGDIIQYPPAHSAVKQDGKPLYELARKGHVVELKPRQATVSVFETDLSELPEIRFRIQCSSGTYIRSLANDLGKILGCGAYLQSLRRTSIGDYRIEDAFTLEEGKRFFGSAMNARIIVPKAIAY